MQGLLAGNICSVLAMITDAVSTSRKSTVSILLFQTASQCFYVVGAVILKGYSAAVQNVVSILRNLLAIWGKQPKWVEWLLVALAVVLGLAFNNRGFIGWLPVVASLEYSIAVFRFRDKEKALKTAFLIMVFLFTIFNAAIMNFVGAASNVFVFFSTLIFLLKDRKTK